MHKCLLFHKVPEGTNYQKGHYSFVESEEAKVYLKSGEAELYDPEKKQILSFDPIDTDLPIDFPGREHLLKAKLCYQKDLKILNDFSWIPGIGKSTEKKIKEWLEIS